MHLTRFRQLNLYAANRVLYDNRVKCIANLSFGTQCYIFNSRLGDKFDWSMTLGELQDNITRVAIFISLIQDNRKNHMSNSKYLNLCILLVFGNERMEMKKRMGRGLFSHQWNLHKDIYMYNISYATVIMMTRFKSFETNLL